MAPDDGGIVAAFSRDPDAHPLPTPSGRIEIASATIAGFGHADCPGHPVWLAPVDVPDTHHTLRLIANQPARRLHSQLDFGEHSQEGKQRGREVARMHPSDAAARGIADGDIIRLFNARGACLAAAELTEDVCPGVVHCPPALGTIRLTRRKRRRCCVHGNPNVLTRDAGTSRLAQGCTGQLTAVEAGALRRRLAANSRLRAPRAGDGAAGGRVTAVRLAKKLRIKQEAVSRPEQRTDMLLSTLDHYLRRLGDGSGWWPNSKRDRR